MAYCHGIQYENPAAWTPEEVAMLEEKYPLLGRASYLYIPGKSAAACGQKAQKLGLRYLQEGSCEVQRIRLYLEAARIPYGQEACIPACRNERALQFDFAVFWDAERRELKGLIEFDGGQHFVPCFYYANERNSAKEVFLRTRRCDGIKNRFCEENGIPLLRIKFCQQERLEALLEDFLARPEHYVEWHNPELSREEYYPNFGKEALYEPLFAAQPGPPERGYRERCRAYRVLIRKWTDAEDLFLQKHYAEKGGAWVAERLKKTVQACRCRARRLGLHSHKYWTAREDAFLRAHFAEKGSDWVARQLGRSAAACAHRAARLGIIK